jgi:uncharacterized protein (DUF2062 family)
VSDWRHSVRARRALRDQQLLAFMHVLRHDDAADDVAAGVANGHRADADDPP